MRTDYDRLISGDYILVTGSGTMEEIYGWHFQAGDKLLIHASIIDCNASPIAASCSGFVEMHNFVFKLSYDTIVSATVSCF